MNNMCVLDNWVGYDYKSIALPAELQGHKFFCQLVCYILIIISSTQFFCLIRHEYSYLFSFREKRTLKVRILILN